jgi:KDO2-lipid IV(A) lauroyltransferase
LRELETVARERSGLSAAPTTLAGVRQMLRALRQGQTIGLLPDQVPPKGQGVWTPFFGRPAYTMTLAARLVRQTGATPLAIWCERLPGAAGYRVRVQALAEPLPPPPPAGADAGQEEAWTLQATSAVNRSIEAMVLQCPAQYLWGYQRYKHPRKA